MSSAHSGWVNAHTHLYGGLRAHDLLPPGPAPKGYLDRCRSFWWRLDRALDEESLRAAARLYVAESLLAGTTALVDHHESPCFIEGSLDVLADVCEELGMRAVLCYAATERNGGRDEARRGLAECRRFLRENQRSLVRGVVGLHASFTVSDETIREAAELALRFGTVTHVHVAEDECDVLDALRRGYSSPLARLAGLGALPAGSILAQCVHLSLEAVQGAAERGLWLVQSPRSNERSGVGHPSTFAESEYVALGTDGLPSDPLDEAEALLRVAARSLEPLERAASRVHAGDRLLAQRFGVRSAHRASVSRGGLVVGGRIVVENGELQTGDIAEIRARAREAAERVTKRMDEL